MTGQMTFEVDGLDRLGGALDDGARRIADELQTLENAAAALAGGWVGDAQRAYDHAQREWSASMSALRAVVAEAGRLAHNAAQRYDTVEHHNAELWRI